MQSIGVKTGVVELRPLRDEIGTFGNVETDETRLSEVQVRFSGSVQKVYADATYKAVRQVQPLLTIYSPELVTAEQDYLVANVLLAQSGGGMKPHRWHTLLNASAERLMGQLQIQIARLKKTGKIRRELEVDAPVSGSEFVIATKARNWGWSEGIGSGGRMVETTGAHKVRASRVLQRLAHENANLFEHWRLGMTGTFA
jgi:HlyD family secretion protein